MTFRNILETETLILSLRSLFNRTQVLDIDTPRSCIDEDARCCAFRTITNNQATVIIAVTAISLEEERIVSTRFSGSLPNTEHPFGSWMRREYKPLSLKFMNLIYTFAQNCDHFPSLFHREHLQAKNISPIGKSLYRIL